MKLEVLCIAALASFVSATEYIVPVGTDFHDYDPQPGDVLVFEDGTHGELGGSDF